MELLSKKTGSKGSLEFVPHFSIRNDFLIDDESMDRLTSEITDFISNVPRMKLQITGFGFYPWKIIYLDIQKIPELQSLHNNIMNIIQRYRNSWVAKNLIDSPHFSGKQKEYIQKYGYQFAFEFYSPHFTVCGNDITEQDFELLQKELTQLPISEVFLEKIMFMDRDNENKPLIEICSPNLS